MASKIHLFAAVLLVIVFACSAQAPVLGVGLMNITGTVYCSISSSLPTPAVFSNAAVQLQCAGSTVASASTNSNEVFSISLSSTTVLLLTLLSNCNLVVTTPLATCKASFPSTGFLQSALQLLNGGLVVLGFIFNLAPIGFSLVQ